MAFSPVRKRVTVVAAYWPKSHTPVTLDTYGPCLALPPPTLLTANVGVVSTTTHPQMTWHGQTRRLAQGPVATLDAIAALE